MWHFLHWPYRSAIGALSRIPLPNQQHPWWRPVKDEAVVRRPVNVLTRRDRPQWGSREVWVVQEALRRVAEARHLRPSRDHVVGGLEIQVLS
jgi:hypothetical protein